MRIQCLATFSLLALLGGAAMAAEPAESDPLVTLDLRGLDLQAALEALSAQSGRRFLLTEGADAAVEGPDIKMSNVRLSVALETLAAVYRVCSVERPGLTSFEDCAGVATPSPGKVRLGVALVTMTPDTNYERGGIVTHVQPDSVAARAGIEPEDRIIAFNGRPIFRASQLVEAVRELEPGAIVTIELVRRNQRVRLAAQF